MKIRLLFILLIINISFCFYQWPVWKTNGILERAAKSGEITENDAWNRPIFLHVEKNNNGVFTFARSLGRDGVESEDNLGFLSVDWNKSGIIGEFAGKRAKEVGKGFWRGLFKE